MQIRMGVGFLCLLGLVGLAGCHAAPAPPSDTGARAFVKAYFEALVRQDWAAAFASLHADTIRRISPAQFAQQAASLRQSLGFEPVEVHLRSCEEHGEEAVAHIILTGQSASHQHFYKDAVKLRRSESSWKIVLPPNFGSSHSR